MTTPYTPQTIPVGLGSDREAGTTTPAPKSAPEGEEIKRLRKRVAQLEAANANLLGASGI